MPFTADPLTVDPPDEIPLANAPLVRVIAQVRFPMVLAAEEPATAAAFQSTLGDDYPVLRQEQTQRLAFGPGGLTSSGAVAAWRFSTLDEAWRVSMSQQFVALETTAYTSRAGFLSRLRQVLTAAEKHLAPRLVDRVGMRYVDRITGAELVDVAALVREPFRGLAGSPLETAVRQAVTETVLDTDGGTIVARWGVLPPGVTVDPGAIDPIQERSWVLDLDMFSTKPAVFSVEGTIEHAGRFASRLYAIFRYAVTDEFLQRYGAKS